MKASILTSTLLELLNPASAAVKSDALYTEVILSADTSLGIRVLDNSFSFADTRPAVVYRPGAFLLGQSDEAGKTFLAMRDFVAMLDPDARCDLSVEADENKLKLRLRQGKVTARFTVKRETAEPVQQPAQEVFRVRVNDLLRGVRLTIRAAAKDCVRPVLNAICFSLADGKLELKASNGYWGALHAASADVAVAEAREYVANLDALERLMRVTAKMKLADDEVISARIAHGGLEFVIGNAAMTVQLVALKYPDLRSLFRQVDPAAPRIWLDEAVRAFKTLKPFRTATRRATQLMLQRGILIFSLRGDHGDASVELTVEADTTAQRQLLVDLDYINAAVKALHDDGQVKAQLDFGVENAPLQLETDDTRYLIMPLKKE